MTRTRVLTQVLTLSLAMALLPRGEAAVPTATVDWQPAASDADVAQAFARSRAEHKPLLLYWGASWCPPCNQLKATLFNRQDFIERSKRFVAVHVDGDAPGAQRLGARFKVQGYPTLILFSPAGAEITRLPGEADAPQVMQLLQLGLADGRPIKAVLADVLAGRPVGPDEWRLLAFYSWETDENQLVGEAGRPALLARLARACPAAQAEVATRLLLQALASRHDGQGGPVDAASRQRVRQLLADAPAARQQMDLLVNDAPELVQALAPAAGPERAALAAQFDHALQTLQADASLSRADRFSALGARVDLARLDGPRDALHPALPPALTQQVRELSARDDRDITDPYERQAVITEAAYVLGQAGLWADSDALLKANLAKSHSPYYLMSELGSNARRQGRTAQALDWYGQAFARSQGPATRLQWGAGYLSALVDLAPGDEARIEQTARQILDEAARQPAAFDERSGRSLQRLGHALTTWNAHRAHPAVMDRLRARLQRLCGGLPRDEASQRRRCEALI